MNSVTPTFLIPSLIVGLATSAVAIPIGPTSSPSRWLGTVNPGSPANPTQEVGYINFLLNSSGAWVGYNDGGTAGSPFTVGGHTYTLQNDNAPADLIPDSAPNAILTGSVKDDDDPNNSAFDLDNPITLGGIVNVGGIDIQLADSYDWLILKFGNITQVVYIGDMGAGTELTFDTTGPAGNGLSHWSLYNASTAVPDGGASVALLGLSLLGLGGARRLVRTRKG